MAKFFLNFKKDISSRFEFHTQATMHCKASKIYSYKYINDVIDNQINLSKNCIFF